MRVQRMAVPVLVVLSSLVLVSVCAAQSSPGQIGGSSATVSRSEVTAPASGSGDLVSAIRAPLRAYFGPRLQRLRGWVLPSVATISNRRQATSR